jgi:Cysteine-rich CWC
MSLQKSSGISLPQYREPSVCEACGAQFVCGASGSSCWCQEIKLSEAAQAELRARYQRCLCRACLENYAEVEKNNGEKEEQVSTGTTH